jgi:heme-degrading monooxygenase HmoA
MAVYQSMQRVRFSSEDGYKKFQMVFSNVRHHLKKLPGFLHLTCWVHPDDPHWYSEVSFWTSFEALKDWHMDTYHKHAKEWAVRTGAIMEDIIVNFEYKNARLIPVCPACAHISDTAFDVAQEQAALAQRCPKPRTVQRSSRTSRRQPSLRSDRPVQRIRTAMSLKRRPAASNEVARPCSAP